MRSVNFLTLSIELLMFDQVFFGDGYDIISSEEEAYDAALQSDGKLIIYWWWRGH